MNKKRVHTTVFRSRYAVNKAYHMSKVGIIGSLVVLVPFLAYTIWSESVFYSEPIPRVFDDVKFRVSGSAKSPPTIILYKGGKNIFFSECNGLKEAICNRDEYWSAWHVAQQATAIESSPKHGVIKRIVIDADGGKVIEAIDSDTDSKIGRFGTDLWRGVYGIVFVFVLSALLFLIARTLKNRYFQGD